MRDEFENEVTADDVLEGFEHDLENVFWPVLNDDSELTDDQRAEVTRHMEQAEEAIKAARKITAGSSASE